MESEGGSRPTAPVRRRDVNGDTRTRIGRPRLSTPETNRIAEDANDSAAAGISRLDDIQVACGPRTCANEAVRGLSKQLSATESDTGIALGHLKGTKGCGTPFTAPTPPDRTPSGISWPVGAHRRRNRQPSAARRNDARGNETPSSASPAEGPNGHLLPRDVRPKLPRGPATLSDDCRPARRAGRSVPRASRKITLRGGTRPP